MLLLAVDLVVSQHDLVVFVLLGGGEQGRLLEPAALFVLLIACLVGFEGEIVEEYIGFNIYFSL